MNAPEPTPAGDPSPTGESSPRVRAVSPPQAIPVFTCRAYVRRDADGQVQARCANLPECHAHGPSEPAALRLLVAAFKAAVSRYTGAGAAIPWREPPEPRAADEQERLLAVHL